MKISFILYNTVGCLCVCLSQILHLTCSAYISWNNGQILMFKVPDMMRLYGGGATTPLVVKIWTKQPWVKIENLLFTLPISPEIMDRFWCSRCLNNRIEVPDIIGSLASGTNALLVAKNGTRKISQPFGDRFSCSRCQNYHIEVPNIIGSFACGATTSLVAKNGT